MLLCACGIFSHEPPPPPPKPKVVKHVEPPPKLEEEIIYPADSYLLHLSLAELTLKGPSAPLSAIAADFDIARAYTLQKQDGGTLQPVVILEYAIKGAPKHNHLIIPITMPVESSDMAALEETMARLGPLPYTLYDMKLGVISLPPIATLGDEGKDARAAEFLIESRLQPLIKEAAPFPPMVQARINLKLSRFFTLYRYKEPAYFAIENAKQSLAAVDESATGEETGSLSQEIDAQEGLLHKTMPFTLGF